MVGTFSPNVRLSSALLPRVLTAFFSELRPCLEALRCSEGHLVHYVGVFC